jgi:cytochrome b pre-mRNA-processing protein 3
MIHKRLMIEGKDGLLVQEALFDELWEDTSGRIRAAGIGEMSVNKYLKEVQSYSFRTCVDLDHVLTLKYEPGKTVLK